MSGAGRPMSAEHELLAPVLTISGLADMTTVHGLGG